MSEAANKYKDTVVLATRVFESSERGPVTVRLEIPRSPWKEFFVRTVYLCADAQMCELHEGWKNVSDALFSMYCEFSGVAHRAKELLGATLRYPQVEAPNATGLECVHPDPDLDELVEVLVSSVEWKQVHLHQSLCRAPRVDVALFDSELARIEELRHLLRRRLASMSKEAREQSLLLQLRPHPTVVSSPAPVTDAPIVATPVKTRAGRTTTLCLWVPVRRRDAWGCPFSLVGDNLDVHAEALGTDSMAALINAYSAIEAELDIPRVLGAYEQWPTWDPETEFINSDFFYFVRRTGTYRLHLLAIEVLKLQLYCALIPGASPTDTGEITRLLRRHLERKIEVDLALEAQQITRTVQNSTDDLIHL